MTLIMTSLCCGDDYNMFVSRKNPYVLAKTTEMIKIVNWLRENKVVHFYAYLDGALSRMSFIYLLKHIYTG